jgi:2-polyprenyl-3-methyl-5-hydroxy-6-metoxy-1,4-benzoquinol methylase
MIDPYALRADGTWQPPVPPVHRDADYDSSGFESLRSMQQRHFWYRGRHRFLLHFTQSVVDQRPRGGERPAAIDLGGGCGGWVRYLAAHAGGSFREIAVADSSQVALTLAASEVPASTRRYHIDLLNLQWADRWDLAFLLDVLEHIEDDEEVLRQIYHAITPGGYLLITTPALERFRTNLDNMTHHVRRYSRADFKRLAERTGFEEVVTRYFMFLLSPLLLAARFNTPDPAAMTPQDIRQYLDRTQRAPVAPVNAALTAIFAAETPLGAWLPFPWGSSILAVLRRPQR